MNSIGLQANEADKLKPQTSGCKMINISRWRASKILVNLISAGIIRSHNTEKVEFYTLS